MTGDTNRGSIRTASAVHEVQMHCEESARLGLALDGIDMTIASTIDFDQIFQRALNEGVTALGADSGAIEMREGGSWVLRYEYGSNGARDGLHLTDADAPLATLVERLREPYTSEHLMTDPHMNDEFVSSRGLKSVLAVPLIVRDVVTGCMLFYTKQRPKSFGSEEMAFARRLATAVSLALENARLFAAEREARQQARQELSRTTLLNNVAVAAMTSVSPDEVARRILNAMAEDLDLRVGEIYVYEPRTRFLALLAALGVNSDHVEKISALEVNEQNPALASKAVLERRIVTSNDIPISEARHRMLSDAGSTDTKNVAIPIEGNEGVIGILSLAFERVEPFRPDEFTIFQSLASIVGRAIQNAQHFAAEKEHSRLAEALDDIAHVIHSTLDFDKIMQRALALGTDALSADAGTIEVRSDDLWLVRYQHGFTPEDVGLLLREGEAPLASEAARLREPLTITDMTADPKLNVGFVEEHSLKSALAVPLIVKEVVVGCLLFYGAREPRSFSEAEVDFGRKLGSSMALALDNARLSEQRARQADLTEALNRAGELVHSSLEIDEIMKSVASEAAKALRVEAVAVEVCERDKWPVRYGHGLPAEAFGQTLIGDSIIARRVESTGRQFVVNDVTEDADLKSVALTGGVRALLAAPLVVRGKVFGVVIFMQRTMPRTFSDEDVDFARRLSASVSLALENARLYEAERDIANRLQEALVSLPDKVKGIEFAHAYHSASETARVGGDFYDVFELNSHHVGITIGDIAGKGVDAAVLTSLVKNTIRAHANEAGKSPARILALTNDIVYRTTATEAFATVFFAILDCRDGRLVYSNAGHTSAALVRDDGATTTLPVTGPILGAFNETTFKQSETWLELNEFLFLYTDGLTEARRGGELYGEERIMNFLSSTRNVHPLDVVGEVITDVMSFASNNLRDDLAILAVKRLDPGADTPMQQKLVL